MIFGISIGFLMKPEMWIPDSAAIEMKGMAQFFGWEGGRITVGIIHKILNFFGIQSSLYF